MVMKRLLFFALLKLVSATAPAVPGSSPPGMILPISNAQPISLRVTNTTMTLTQGNCSSYSTSTVVQLTTVTAVPSYMTMSSTLPSMPMFSSSQIINSVVTDYQTFSWRTSISAFNTLSNFTPMPRILTVSRTPTMMPSTPSTSMQSISIPYIVSSSSSSSTAPSSSSMMSLNSTRVYPMTIPIPTYMYSSLSTTSSSSLVAPSSSATLPFTFNTNRTSSLSWMTTTMPSLQNYTISFPSSLSFPSSSLFTSSPWIFTSKSQQPVTVTVTKCPKAIHRIASVMLQTDTQSITIVTDVVRIRPSTQTIIRELHGYVPVITSVFTNAISTLTVSQMAPMSSAITLVGSEIYWLDAIEMINQQATQTISGKAAWTSAWTSEWVVSNGQTIPITKTASATSSTITSSIGSINTAMQLNSTIQNTFMSVSTSLWTMTLN